jgi:hypothetical protein
VCLSIMFFFVSNVYVSWRALGSKVVYADFQRCWQLSRPHC